MEKVSRTLPHPCAVRHCERPARWTVTIAGHPNSRGFSARYCTEHAREKAGTLWEDSPEPYCVTVEGPHAWKGRAEAAEARAVRMATYANDVAAERDALQAKVTAALDLLIPAEHSEDCDDTHCLCLLGPLFAALTDPL